MNRQNLLDHLRQHPDISVLIIGAGINGIGTFRDLALQGVDVLLIDKSDFCAGASAASSHMVHGGIRYLENGEFRLVREAVQERNRLIQNAPHYVKPLATTIPIFKWFSGLLNAPLKFLNILDKPGERGAIVIKAGLLMYDAYTRSQGTVPRHNFAWRQQALAQTPQLNPEIIGTATYYDAMMPSPERICIDLLRDAQTASNKALALNYVRAGEAQGDTITLHDEVGGETVRVKPKIVINAAGPWIDLANEAMGQPTHFIGGTKGSHLVLDHPALSRAIDGHEFFFENDDGRIVLIYPLMDKVLVGTSDIYIDHPDEARCTEAEIDYFLAMIQRVFPTIEVNRTHIVFQFSGVRPLPASDAQTTGQISRDHTIRVIDPGDQIKFPIYCLIGGKWTTFRAFAEQTADKVLAYLGQPRQQSTANLAVGGGKGYPQTPAEQQEWIKIFQQKYDLSPTRLAVLLHRYGTHAQAIAAYIAAGEDAPLRYQPDYSQREIAYLATHEWVVHLDDLILRRSLLGMLGQVTADLLPELAQTVAQALGWTATQQQTEVARTSQLLADQHGIHLKELIS